MCAEAEGIFLWALEGLHRLIDNDYKFTVSQSAQDNMDAAVSDGNNIIEFLSSEGYIRFKADYEVSSKDLYAVYKLWCDDNALSSLSQKSFCSFLKQNESRYNIEYTNKVNIGGGGMPEELSASSFCKDHFCKNDIDPKIRVPSVPSVPRYSKYTWYTYFSVRFTIIFQCCWRMPCFWALKINGNENRKDFDRRTKPFHEIVLL